MLDAEVINVYDTVELFVGDIVPLVFTSVRLGVAKVNVEPLIRVTDMTSVDTNDEVYDEEWIDKLLEP